MRGEATISRLLMLPTAPVIETGNGTISLDVKFAEGMQHSCKIWPGRIDCILRKGAESIPFGGTYQVADLDYGLQVIDEEDVISPDMLRDYDVVLGAGDSHHDLHITDHGAEADAKIIYAIEYTIGTRLQIALMDPTRNWPRRLYSAFWHLRKERLRRRAFRQADGIQANGYPALNAYRSMNANTLLYLDNRMKPEMFATTEEMTARLDHIREGHPLRLINSGRLEPMKGAQDLIPIARHLRDKGVAFTLDIYGTGSLEAHITEEIARHDLAAVVTLHAPVDFETELVPLSRTKADVFLSCHRQSDPSCTYLEAMGCGLAIAGYGNQMWSGLRAQSKAGWIAPLGKPISLAERIIEINESRDALISACRSALEFARSHDFVTEFKMRNDQLISASK